MMAVNLNIKLNSHAAWPNFLIILQVRYISTCTVLFEVQRFPTFRDSRYMKVVRVSDLITGHHYTQVIFLVFISFRG
jgi:hypothetical protein